MHDMQQSDGQLAYLGLRILGSTQLNKMAQGSCVRGDEDLRLSSIRQYAACRLARRFAALRALQVRLRGLQPLNQHVSQRDIRLMSLANGTQPEIMQLRV